MYHISYNIFVITTNKEPTSDTTETRVSYLEENGMRHDSDNTAMSKNVAKIERD